MRSTAGARPRGSAVNRSLRTADDALHGGGDARLGVPYELLAVGVLPERPVLGFPMERDRREQVTPGLSDGHESGVRPPAFEPFSDDVVVDLTVDVRLGEVADRGGQAGRVDLPLRD